MFCVSFYPTNNIFYFLYALISIFIASIQGHLNDIHVYYKTTKLEVGQILQYKFLEFF